SSVGGVLDGRLPDLPQDRCAGGAGARRRLLRPLTARLYARNTDDMALQRRVRRIGGSLGVLLPRDIAEAMGVKEGSEVRLTVVGRQVVVEPVDDMLDDGAVRRALAAVLRRHGRAFRLLAAYDRGVWAPPRRGRARYA